MTFFNPASQDLDLTLAAFMTADPPVIWTIKEKELVHKDKIK